VLLGHRREEWERDEPLLDGLRHRAQAGTVLEPLAIKRMPVDERIVERRAYVLGAQGLEDRVAVDGQAVETQQHQEEMPAVPPVSTPPPAPVVISFAGWKESVVMSASAPTGRRPYAPPKECAASAMTVQPCSRASGSNRSYSQGRPAKSTDRTARVRGVAARF